jgi:hypothetical protein
MGNQRTTFGKLQRERDKKAKAMEKAEKRAARQAEAQTKPEDDGQLVDQDALLEALADLHQRFEAKVISIDEFEERREQLTNLLSGAL